MDIVESEANLKENCRLCFAKRGEIDVANDVYSMKQKKKLIRFK